MKKIAKLMLSLMAVVCLLTGMGFTSFAQTEDIQILKLVVTEKVPRERKSQQTVPRP